MVVLAIEESVVRSLNYHQGDVGFSLPEILTVCERAGVSYAFGWV
jgi:hypothetical protein